MVKRVDGYDADLTFLIFLSGAYIALDVHELVAVVSCFVPCDKSKEEGRLARELEGPLQLLRDTARRVAEVKRGVGWDERGCGGVGRGCSNFLEDRFFLLFFRFFNF